MRITVGADLTIPLRFSDYGSNGARIYTCDADDANCALCFTEAEIEREWPVSSARPNDRPSDGARAYAEARIGELDSYLQGDVYGIVIRTGTEDGCAAEIEHERAEAERWACADVVTVS